METCGNVSHTLSILGTCIIYLNLQKSIIIGYYLFSFWWGWYSCFFSKRFIMQFYTSTQNQVPRLLCSLIWIIYSHQIMCAWITRYHLTIYHEKIYIYIWIMWSICYSVIYIYNNKSLNSYKYHIEKIYVLDHKASSFFCSI